MNLLASLHKPKTEPPVSVTTAADDIRKENAFLVDVRSPGEYASGHAVDAHSIPLDQVEKRVDEFPTDRPVLVMCQSGTRSAMAVKKLHSLGRTNVSDVVGGFSAWQQANLPTVGSGLAIPLERQVRIAAGAFVLSFSLLGFFVNRRFLYLSTAVGVMLFVTGILNICPMMALLELMPWNRPRNAG